VWNQKDENRGAMKERRKVRKRVEKIEDRKVKRKTDW
jgi:hypothetical protein